MFSLFYLIMVVLLMVMLGSVVLVLVLLPSLLVDLLSLIKCLIVLESEATSSITSNSYSDEDLWRMILEGRTRSGTEFEEDGIKILEFQLLIGLKSSQKIPKK